MRRVTDPPSPPRPTVGEVLLDLLRRPQEHLLRRWNWKSAVLSAAIRAAIFFFVNLRHGWRAGVSALLTELAFRGATSGFYGSLTEAFRHAEPPWAAAVTAMVLLPVVSHVLEFAVHWLRGTADLKNSILASATFTVVSTLFNLYAMRRGALVVGSGRVSLAEDMRRMPRIILDFVLLLPLSVARLLRAR